LAKPEWGTKRICQSCGTRFYDLGRTPIVCPSCGAVFDLEILSRARRARPAVRAAAVDEGTPVAEDGDAIGAGVGLEEVEEEALEEDEAVIEAEDAEEEEEDESLIEDASELGEDDDMSDVIDSDIGEEEPR
jgi:uncharacterized protein (TIGR02300 family)